MKCREDGCNDKVYGLAAVCHKHMRQIMAEGREEVEEMGGSTAKFDLDMLKHEQDMGRFEAKYSTPEKGVKIIDVGDMTITEAAEEVCKYTGGDPRSLVSSTWHLWAMLAIVALVLIALAVR